MEIYKPKKIISSEEGIKESELIFSPEKRNFYHPFKATTPEGNKIKGWICSSPDQNLGLLILEEVNGEKFIQKIPSMSKIGYPYYEGKFEIKWPQNIVDIRFNKK